MDERSSLQLTIDFRTGRQSAIHQAGGCDQQRSACVALNRIRTRGILEASSLLVPGESVSAPLWEALFKRRADEWQLPLIDLEAFGISHDADGFRTAREDFWSLPSGAEAAPYRDRGADVVYKLFDLRSDGSLGKKISFERSEHGEFEVVIRSAQLRDTLEKLILLNEIGAHPTEIVGLSVDGDYLIVKQPLAVPSPQFSEDRDSAIHAIKGVVPAATGLRTTICVVWLNGQTWLVGDLHERNIMIDGDGRPTIIDALVGPVSPMALRKNRWLSDAAADAEALRLGLPPPKRRSFDDYADSDL